MVYLVPCVSAETSSPGLILRASLPPPRSPGATPPSCYASCAAPGCAPTPPRTARWRGERPGAGRCSAWRRPREDWWKWMKSPWERWSLGVEDCHLLLCFICLDIFSLLFYFCCLDFIQNVRSYAIGLDRHFCLGGMFLVPLRLMFPHSKVRNTAPGEHLCFPLARGLSALHRRSQSEVAECGRSAAWKRLCHGYCFWPSCCFKWCYYFL